MEKRAGLGRYYLVFGLLFVFTLAVLVLTLMGGKDAKQDKATAAKTAEIASKLNAFIDANGSVPTTLDDAGVNSVPGSITYVKIDGSKYRLCANYKTAANSIDAGWAALLTGVVSSVNHTPPTTSNSSFLDSYKLAYTYKKGQNCQTVSPLTSAQLEGSGPNGLGSLNPSAAKENLISAKCSSGANFELKVATTVKAIDSSQGILTLETANAQLVDKNPKPVNSLSVIKYDGLTAVYKTSCKTGTIEDINALKAGAHVTVYLYNHQSTYADQIEL